MISRAKCVSWISITRARNAMDPLGDNLIRELTGQSDPECKLSVMVATPFSEISHGFSRGLLASVGGKLQARQVLGCTRVLKFPMVFLEDSWLLLMASCKQGKPWVVIDLESISRLHVCSVSTLSRLVAPSCRSAFHSCTLHP